MKIQYLSDVKKALEDIPNDVLELIGWRTGEESESVEMCVWEAEDYMEKWEEYNRKYPQLQDIAKWIRNVQTADTIMSEDKDTDEFDWMEEPISSEYKFK